MNSIDMIVRPSISIPVRLILLFIGAAVIVCSVVITAILPGVEYAQRLSALQTLMTAAQMFGLLSIADEIRSRITKDRFAIILALVRWPQDISNIEYDQNSFRLDTGNNTFVVVLKNIGRERLDNIRIVLSASPEDQQRFRLTSGHPQDHLHFLRGGASDTMELSSPIKTLIPNETSWAWAAIQRNTKDDGDFTLGIEVAADNLPFVLKREFTVYLPPDRNVY